MPDQPEATPGRQIPTRAYQPRLSRSVLDVATSIVPYLALSVLLDLTLGISVLLTVSLVVLAAGLLAIAPLILFSFVGFEGQNGAAEEMLARYAWCGLNSGERTWPTWLMMPGSAWFARTSSSSGSTADWPRSMIDWPPIWITFSCGRMRRTGASVPAITARSTNDSRISVETTC